MDLSNNFELLNMDETIDINGGIAFIPLLIAGGKLVGAGVLAGAGWYAGEKAANWLFN